MISLNQPNVALKVEVFMHSEHLVDIKKLIEKKIIITNKLSDLLFENQDELSSFLTFLNSVLADLNAYDSISLFIIDQNGFEHITSQVKSIKMNQKRFQNNELIRDELERFKHQSFIYHEALNDSTSLKNQIGVLFDEKCSNYAIDVPIFMQTSIKGFLRFESSTKPFTETFILFISSVFDHQRQFELKKVLLQNDHTLLIKNMYQQALYDMNKIAFFTYDIDQKITYWEKGSSKVFGVESDDLLTKDFMINQVHADDFHKLNLSTHDTIKTKGKNTMTYRIKINHQDHWFLSYQTYVTIHQKPYLIGFIEDISNPLAKVEHFMDYQTYTDTLSMTRIKELEKENQAALATIDSKNKYISNMSHEIRTPMNSIIGYTELLKTLTLNDEQKEYVERIYDASKHLLSIVNDVLDLSKLEAGKIVIEKIPFQISTLLSSVKDIFEDILRQKRLYLDIETMHCPNYIVGDENRIRQILINLISNAIKFTEVGGISLVVSAKEDDEKDHYIFDFKVKDTGIGMTPVQLSKLFQDFSQADISTSRLYGGTGLGLSISKRLSHLLGGDLNVTSNLNDGTEFILNIPLIKHKETLEKQEQSLSNVVPKKGSKILIVDDNPLNLKLLERILIHMSMTITVAENGSIALDLARNQRFDLILLDIQMPIMDGIETTKNIRLFDQKTPIIAMTGDTSFEVKQLALQVGMNDYLVKPIDQQSLYKALSKFIPEYQKK